MPHAEDPQRLRQAKTFAAIFDLYWPRFLQVAAFGLFVLTLAVPSLRDPSVWALAAGSGVSGVGGQLIRRGGRSGR